jgi:hypothetical protein
LVGLEQGLSWGCGYRFCHGCVAMWS